MYIYATLIFCKIYISDIIIHKLLSQRNLTIIDDKMCKRQHHSASIKSRIQSLQTPFVKHIGCLTEGLLFLSILRLVKSDLSNHSTPQLCTFCHCHPDSCGWPSNPLGPRWNIKAMMAELKSCGQL